MNLNVYTVVASYVAILGVAGLVGLEFGGLYWVPFTVAAFPVVAVGLGYVYGLVFGTNVGSVDDSVSKGMEYRDDFDPEEEYDHE